MRPGHARPPGRRDKATTAAVDALTQQWMGSREDREQDAETEHT